jgi:hypothetical protein
VYISRIRKMAPETDNAAKKKSGGNGCVARRVDAEADEKY